MAAARGRQHAGRPNLVTVVMDVDEAAWASASAANLAKLREQGGAADVQAVSLASALKSVVVFLNAVRLLSRDNEVALIAECPDGQARLWSSQTVPLAKAIKREARAFGQAYAQLEPERRGKTSLGVALSKALCSTNRTLHEHKARFGVEPLARVLVVQAREDDATQYIASMNVAFAAEKRNVCVDVCDFTPGRSTILQQVAHQSGGILQHYLGISAEAFTQYLLSVFLSDAEDRKLLRVPPQAPLVMEAACFCHGQLKSRGWVCSVCLSVFCKDPCVGKKAASTCPTCRTRILVT